MSIDKTHTIFSMVFPNKSLLKKILINTQGIKTTLNAKDRGFTLFNNILSLVLKKEDKVIYIAFAPFYYILVILVFLINYPKEKIDKIIKK